MRLKYRKGDKMAIFTDTVNNVKLTFICQQREADSVDLELIDFLPEL